MRCKLLSLAPSFRLAHNARTFMAQQSETKEERRGWMMVRLETEGKNFVRTVCCAINKRLMC